MTKPLTQHGLYGLMRPVARIAQSVEQGIENPRVLGSIPSPGTIIQKNQPQGWFFAFRDPLNSLFSPLPLLCRNFAPADLHYFPAEQTLNTLLLSVNIRFCTPFQVSLKNKIPKKPRSDWASFNLSKKNHWSDLID